jgi:peroxiredoxin
MLSPVPSAPPSRARPPRAPRGWGGTGRPSRRGLAPLALLGIALLGVALGVAVLTAAASEDPFRAMALLRPPRPQPARAFTVPTLDGGSLRLADYRGRVVVLNFWATWCPPCREEMPAMERLYRRFEARGVVVVAISIDADRSLVGPFVKEHGLTFPVGLDPGMEVAGQYGVRGLPATFLVDAGGRLVASALGPREWDSAEAAAVVESLLNARR